MGLEWMVVDVETNGLSSSMHEINEISIIRCKDRFQLTEFVKCDHPERSNYDALRITNKTLKDLENGISKEEVVEKIDKFINEDGLTPAHRCFIGHNCSFDRKFIYAMYEKIGKSCPVHLWLDTIALSKDFLKKSDPSQLNIIKTATGRVSTTLHSCCDMVGVKKLSEAHASKVDSRNTYLLWKQLVEVHKIDYLPHIKTFPHTLENNLANIDDLDLSDVF